MSSLSARVHSHRSRRPLRGQAAPLAGQPGAADGGGFVDRGAGVRRRGGARSRCL